MVNNKIRIGIAIVGGKGWMGGVGYIESVINAIKNIEENKRPEIYLISYYYKKEDIEVHRYLENKINGIIIMGGSADFKTEWKNHIKCKNFWELYKLIDFYYPTMIFPFKYFPSASWIPDFQYKYLPKLFSKYNIMRRNRVFSLISRKAKLIVLSSYDSEEDFKKFYPESKAITKVFRFRVAPREEWYQGNISEIIDKFKLSQNYFLVCNQFWTHKNYEVLFRAIGLLKKNNIEVKVVCTGSTKDIRSKQYFDYLKLIMKEEMIEENIIITGIVSKEEQIQLMRGCLAVIQPSLFEGWSTVVEEARTLGKNIILSDLKVNIEQNPEFGVYFEKTSFEDLAIKIRNIIESISKGYNEEREYNSRKKAEKLIYNSAIEFEDIIKTTIKLYENKNTLYKIYLYLESKKNDFLFWIEKIKEQVKILRRKK